MKNILLALLSASLSFVGVMLMGYCMSIRRIPPGSLGIFTVVSIMATWYFWKTRPNAVWLMTAHGKSNYSLRTFWWVPTKYLQVFLLKRLILKHQRNMSCGPMSANLYRINLYYLNHEFCQLTG